MRVRSSVLRYVHLDKSYSLLSAKNVCLLLEYFKVLDIHTCMSLNDLQFYYLLHAITDLTRNQIYRVFDMLDVDGSGGLEFDEFYLLMCILIAVKDNQEKQFIYRHSRTVFDLLDEDGSNTVSAEEFENLGFLFNFEGAAVESIFNEFDISGDQELDYKEFRMFAMACIDKQTELEKRRQQKLKAKRLKAEARAAKRRKNKVGPSLSTTSDSIPKRLPTISETEAHDKDLTTQEEPSGSHQSVTKKAGLPEANENEGSCRSFARNIVNQGVELCIIM